MAGSRLALTNRCIIIAMKPLRFCIHRLVAGKRDSLRGPRARKPRLRARRALAGPESIACAAGGFDIQGAGMDGDIMFGLA
jgi:hypothetical protein